MLNINMKMKYELWTRFTFIFTEKYGIIFPFAAVICFVGNLYSWKNEPINKIDCFFSKTEVAHSY
jgi:hypothetical protein